MYNFKISVVDNVNNTKLFLISFQIKGRCSCMSRVGTMTDLPGIIKEARKAVPVQKEYLENSLFCIKAYNKLYN